MPKANTPAAAAVNFHLRACSLGWSSPPSRSAEEYRAFEEKLSGCAILPQLRRMRFSGLAGELRRSGGLPSQIYARPCTPCRCHPRCFVMILVKKDAELSLETVPYERFNIVISPPAAFKRGIPRTSGMLALALHVLHYRMLAASSRRTLYLHVRQLPSTRQGQCVPYRTVCYATCTSSALKKLIRVGRPRTRPWTVRSARLLPPPSWARCLLNGGSLSRPSLSSRGRAPGWPPRSAPADAFERSGLSPRSPRQRPLLEACRRPRRARPPSTRTPRASRPDAAQRWSPSLRASRPPPLRPSPYRTM